eukprot:scaffold73_cov252-Pinguiococcus_pyrenoidosus.AAC.13
MALVRSRGHECRARLAPGRPAREKLSCLLPLVPPRDSQERLAELDGSARSLHRLRLSQSRAAGAASDSVLPCLPRTGKVSLLILQRVSSEPLRQVLLGIHPEDPLLAKNPLGQRPDRPGESPASAFAAQPLDAVGTSDSSSYQDPLLEHCRTTPGTRTADLQLGLKYLTDGEGRCSARCFFRLPPSNQLRDLGKALPRHEPHSLQALPRGDRSSTETRGEGLHIGLRSPCWDPLILVHATFSIGSWRDVRNRRSPKVVGNRKIGCPLLRRHARVWRSLIRSRDSLARMTSHEPAEEPQRHEFAETPDLEHFRRWRSQSRHTASSGAAGSSAPQQNALRTEGFRYHTLKRLAACHGTEELHPALLHTGQDSGVQHSVQRLDSIRDQSSGSPSVRRALRELSQVLLQAVECCVAWQAVVPRPGRYRCCSKSHPSA